MKIVAGLQGRELLGRAPLADRRNHSPCACGSCAKCAGSLQRAAISNQAVAAVPASVHATLRGGGHALDPATRGFFETRMGQDFSDVRVHTDAQAAQSAREVQARAYTVGRDLAFGAGQYDPHSATGRKLLAHELAHVVQQRNAPPPPGGLRIGAPRDAQERAADTAAERAMNGLPPIGLAAAPAGMLRRDPLPVLVPGLPQTLASVDIDNGESISADNRKLMQIAQAFQAGAMAGGAIRVRLSAYLPSSTQYDSAEQKRQRGVLAERMREIRAALQALGVPADEIDVSPATIFASHAKGQVEVAVRRPAPLANPLLDPLPGPVSAPPVAPAPVAGGGLPALDLEFKFGPVTVSLPKEVRAKLPIALSRAKSLVIDLSYEVPAKFALKISLDGTPHVRVGVQTGAEIDAKSGATTGSAGLVIDTLATTCHATSANESIAKIKTAGDKLNKAAGEFAAAATFDDKLGKAIDIAGAIGAMYDAVGKAKAGCKQTPRFTFEFGYKRLLTPGSETDPGKLPPLDAIGVTGTWRF